MEQMRIKPKHVKLLRRATLSPLCFRCLLPTWKSDATKLNPRGMRLPSPGRASWQPTKPGRGKISPMGNCEDSERQTLLVKMCSFVTGNKSNSVIKSSQLVRQQGRCFECWTQQRWSEHHCILHMQPISGDHNFKHTHQRQSKTNGNRPVIVGRGSCCRKYQRCYHLQGGKAIL